MGGERKRVHMLLEEQLSKFRKDGKGGRCSTGGFPVCTQSAVNVVVRSAICNNEIKDVWSYYCYGIEGLTAFNLEFLKDLGIVLVSDNNSAIFICDNKHAILGLVIESPGSVKTDSDYDCLKYSPRSIIRRTIFSFITMIPRVILTQGIYFGSGVPNSVQLEYDLDNAETNEAGLVFMETMERNAMEAHIKDTSADFNFEEEDLEDSYNE